MRSPEWLGRLNKAHKLRLMWRDNAIGGGVEPQVWEALQALAEELLDETVIEELWGDRIDHERIPAGEAAPIIMQLLERHGHGAESPRHE